MRIVRAGHGRQKRCISDLKSGVRLFLCAFGMGGAEQLDGAAQGFWGLFDSFFAHPINLMGFDGDKKPSEGV